MPPDMLKIEESPLSLRTTTDDHGQAFIELLLSDREQLALLSADVSVFFKLRDGIGATEVKALTEALNIAIDRLVCVVDSEHPLFQAVAKAAHFIASSSSLVS